MPHWFIQQFKYFSTFYHTWGTVLHAGNKVDITNVIPPVLVGYAKEGLGKHADSKILRCPGELIEKSKIGVEFRRRNKDWYVHRTVKWGHFI